MPGIEKTFCKGYGLSPTHVVPTKRRRSAEDKYVDLGFGLCYRRRRQDLQDSEYNDEDNDYDGEQPLHKRRIPNSFYGSQSARLGVIPAAMLATLHGLIQFGRESVDVGTRVFKAPYAVCTSIPRYVRDVHRAGMVRSMFESIAVPGSIPDLDSWLKVVGSHGRQMYVEEKGDENNSDIRRGGITSPRPGGSDPDSDDFDSATRPDGDAISICCLSERPVHSSILPQSLIPARLPPKMRHSSQNSAPRTRSTYATIVNAGLQTSPIDQEDTQEQMKSRKHTWHVSEQAAESQTASEKVASAMLQRPVRTGCRRGSMLTPFSSAELANLGLQHSKADVASEIPVESYARPVASRKQNTSGVENSTPSTRKARRKAQPENNLQSHVLKKAASRQPNQQQLRHQRAQTLASTEPAPSSRSCSLCHFDNSITSTFCSACYTPRLPEPAPRSRAQGIVKHDLLPDTYPEYGHWGETTMVTIRNYHEDVLCTGAAGPPGTLNKDGSHVSISTLELRQLTKARDDALIEDSMRTVRDQERRAIARENGINVPVHSEPYYSDLKGETAAERLTTRQALILERGLKVERVWMRRLAGWREEAEGDAKKPFPLNVPDYEDLQDWELDRLKEDIKSLDKILASRNDTAGVIRATSSRENSNSKLSGDPKRLAVRNEELKAVQRREVERQYLALVAEAQQQAHAENTQFPEGLRGWGQVGPDEQDLIRWAIYANQVNDMSEQARRKIPTDRPAVSAFSPQDGIANLNGASATDDILNGKNCRPSSETNGRPWPVTESQRTDRSTEQQIEDEHYARLKQKFEDSKWVEMVFNVEVTRYGILYTGRRWPDDVANWETITPAAKALVLEVTEYLTSKEEFEEPGAESK